MKNELEENKKKLKKWRKRAINEKKKIEDFKETEDKNILNDSLSTWTTFNSISSRSPSPSQPSSNL